MSSSADMSTNTDGASCALSEQTTQSAPSAEQNLGAPGGEALQGATTDPAEAIESPAAQDAGAAKTGARRRAPRNVDREKLAADAREAVELGRSVGVDPTAGTVVGAVTGRVAVLVERQELVDGHAIEPGETLEPRHRDGPLAPFVGTEHRRLELLVGRGLDVLQRQSLLSPDQPEPLPDLAAVQLLERLVLVVDCQLVPLVSPDPGATIGLPGTPFGSPKPPVAVATLRHRLGDSRGRFSGSSTL